LGIDELYEQYEQPLLRFARSLTGNREEAEDLAQETFLRAINYISLLGTLSGPQVKSWLFKVLKNCLIDKKRKEKYEVLSEPGEDGSEYSIEAEVESRLLTQQALSYLPEKSRDILYKRYYLNMTSQEIARILSIPAPTVRYHLHMAINLLKRKYKTMND
jgi:RNA polymerase sigma-70 factor (ECF subfamily)